MCPILSIPACLKPLLLMRCRALNRTIFAPASSSPVSVLITLLWQDDILNLLIHPG